MNEREEAIERIAVKTCRWWEGTDLEKESEVIQQECRAFAREVVDDQGLAVLAKDQDIPGGLGLVTPTSNPYNLHRIVK